MATARTALVGHSSRTWVKERVVVSMGSETQCSSGQTYAFHADKTVEIVECTNHVLTRRSVPWALSPAPPLDVTLAFEGQRYQLSFSGPARSPQMRWRKPGQLKPDLTTDIVLGLSKD